MAKSQGIYVLGGYQTDFARNWAREGRGLDAMLVEAITQGLNESGLDPADVGVVHVGNFVAECFAGQGLLGGLVAEVIPDFRGLPSMRHEAACASGSMALLAAMADLHAGYYDLACVVGVEWMRNVPGDQAAQYLGSAAWQGHEAIGARYCWPHLFNGLTEQYQQRYGLDYRHLGAIAELNYRHGRDNPNAQTRHWQFNELSFTCDDQANPVIDGMIRRNDCGQVTDGAAVLFLASPRFVGAQADKYGWIPDALPRITGWAHNTARLSVAAKYADSRDADLVFPQVAQTIQTALHRATVLDPFALDLIETHDCFAITEYMAIDHFGLTAPGQSWRAVEEGWLERGGRLPINPSGGLIGCGHPVGATGVRMMLDLWKQVSGRAGAYQVANARQVAMLNIGGSTTTTACFVLAR
jgi:acetyl-CoA C-acetyltransferase